MIKTPITILDNFFDNPDKIRDYALSLEFEKDPKGEWPGVRSKPLHEINLPLFDELCRRVLSMYFEIETFPSPISWHASMHFQKVDESYVSGWVHRDDTTVITAIVYLNKNSNGNGGTSIYKLKNNILLPNSSELNKYKLDAYKGLIDIKDVQEKKKENNNQYLEIIKVQNEYNRILAFPGGFPHAAQDFFGKKDEEPRLTLVMFFDELLVNRSPIDRVHFVTL
jgi:hypothetical protein